MTPKTRRILVLLLVCLPACQQEMAKQPKYLPYQESDFWDDRRSARPLVAGTVARGHLRANPQYYAGRLRRDPQLLQAATLLAAPDALGMLAASAPLTPYINTFPFPVTADVMHRGQERFNIYCSVCHDRRGTGNGKIVQRGFTRPPSLTAPIQVDGKWQYDLSRGYRVRGIELPIRDAPVGYYYEVISNGFGAMPDYATQVPPQDRWAIIAYLRALQLSQSVNVNDLNANERNAVLEGIRRDQREQQPGR